MACKMVAYHRVSTKEQGASGLGLEAQKSAVARHVAAYACDLIAEYTEVESAAKDDLANRPALQKAIAHAKRSKATLIIAKLDRLARSVYVTAMLHKSGVDFVACDMPSANKMTVQFMAVVAEGEARMISERTRGALAALKARGVPLGAHRPECSGNLSERAAQRGRTLGAQRVREMADEAYTDLVETMRSQRDGGHSLREIAAALNADGHTTRRGRPWNPMQVARVLDR
jgi:DNA invertase Pin-like site-specific DNA recombinase